MYIQKIHIENFRLLKNVDIVLDKSLTLIVGKNNLIYSVVKREIKILNIFAVLSFLFCYFI